MKKSKSEKENLIIGNFIRKNAVLFRDIGDSALSKIAEKLFPEAIPDGFEIMKQGEAGDKLYIVVAGKLDVFVQGADRSVKKAGEIGSGDCVGEGAVITTEPRSFGNFYHLWSSWPAWGRKL
ncbi:MAG: cyclic nucleotide-binding domain-containing protein [Spirochaetia bacterium]|nr:cyclic nucleotide-binding domain-containing protein [Spirochaetia bacterium]